jgi:putative exporter of polyketide antibiotics
MVLCAHWQEQQGVRCKRCRDQLAWTNRLVHPAGEATMSSRTIFLSRLIGLYCIVIALSMMTRRQATVETVTALLQNPSMMLIVGIITLAAGLAVVLAHNIWSGGALVVVVTLVGWITLIKSLFFLFLPPEMEAGFFLGQLHYRQLFYLYTAISLVLGVYRTYGGFKSRSS